MQDAVHRLFYMFHLCLQIFVRSSPKPQHSTYTIVSAFSTFFSCFTKADGPKAFFWIAPSQFLLFSFEGPAKSDFIEDPSLFTTKYRYDPTYLCRIFMISEIKDDKSLPLLSQQYSANRIFLFLHGSSVFYTFTSLGFLLVFRAPNCIVTLSTFNHSHKTSAGPK